METPPEQAGALGGLQYYAVVVAIEDIVCSTATPSLAFILAENAIPGPVPE